MFITSSEAEISFLSELFGEDGLRQWTYVEMALNQPWFCIDILHEEDGVTMGRTFHVANPTLLSSLSESAGDLFQGVEVVLPSYMAGKKGRVIKQLRAIWRGVAPDGTMQIVYVTSAGKRYSCYEGPLHERDLADPRLLFRLRTQRAG